MAGTHATKSPSGAERFTACPGSIPLIESLPPEQRNASGPAAQLGTAAHGLLERCLTTGDEPAKYLGRIIELVGENEDVSILRAGAKAPKQPHRVWFEVDAAMIEDVDVAYNYVLKRCAELGADPKSLQLETRTNPLPDRDDTSGTADVTIDAWPELLEVVDYKNGYMLVEHKQNPQLLSYLTGRAEDTGWSHEKYRITVVQPNADHEDGRVRSFEVTADDLRAFQVKHRAAVEAVDVAAAAFETEERAAWEDEYLRPGEHCTFCSAAAVCRKRYEMAKEQAGIDFDSEPVDQPEPTTPEQVLHILAWKDQMDRLIRAAEQWGQRALEAGRKVPGQKLVRKRSKRVWRDDLEPDAIADGMVKDGLIGANEKSRLFTDPELISGPQAEKLVARKQRKAFEAAYLIKPPGGLVMVPESDPRPEVVPQPGDEFDSEPLPEEE